MLTTTPKIFLQLALKAIGLDAGAAAILDSVAKLEGTVSDRLELVEGYQKKLVFTVDVFFFVSLFSTIFGAHKVVTIIQSALSSFRAEYTLRVRGQRQYYPELGPVQSSLFPGILFSITLLAPYVFILLASIVGVTITIFVLFWKELAALWGWALQMVVPIIVLLILQKFVMEMLVFGKWVRTSNGLVRRPAAFTAVFGAMTFVNFVLGAFYALTRIIFVLLFSGMEIAFRVDKTISGNETSDAAYSSFLALVQSTNEVQNPIFLCATRALCPAVHDTWLPPTPAEKEQSTDAAQEKNDRARRLKVRNKFWLLLTLHRNQPTKYNNYYQLEKYRWFNIEKEQTKENSEVELPQFGISPQEVGAFVVAGVAGGIAAAHDAQR